MTPSDESTNEWWEPQPSQVLVELVEGPLRTIAPRVLSAHLPMAPLSAQMHQSWERRLAGWDVSIGEVFSSGSAEGLVPPELAQMLRQWLEREGVGTGALHQDNEVASMLACAGCCFHTDAHGFSECAFLVVWCSESPDQELSLPHASVRIPLRYGTAILFDPAQPHGVVRAGEEFFEEGAFDPGDLGRFVCFEVDISAPEVSRALGIEFLEPAQDAVDGGRPMVSPLALIDLSGGCEHDSSVDPKTGAWRFRNLLR